MAGVLEWDKGGLDEARSMICAFIGWPIHIPGSRTASTLDHRFASVFLPPPLTAWAPESPVKKDSGCSLRRSQSPSSGHVRLRCPNKATPTLSQLGTLAGAIHAEREGFWSAATDNTNYYQTCNSFC